MQSRNMFAERDGAPLGGVGLSLGQVPQDVAKGVRVDRSAHGGGFGSLGCLRSSGCRLKAEKPEAPAQLGDRVMSCSAYSTEKVTDLEQMRAVLAHCPDGLAPRGTFAGDERPLRVGRGPREPAPGPLKGTFADEEALQAAKRGAAVREVQDDLSTVVHVNGAYSEASGEDSDGGVVGRVKSERERSTRLQEWQAKSTVSTSATRCGSLWDDDEEDDLWSNSGQCP
mmetsp:Transcript_81348/g.235179  ORF Transcript_81348/g.235179 Transcript_81348/m.235179 type:complete len:226 (-) Transcript_81348:236-913(-)